MWRFLFLLFITLSSWSYAQVGYKLGYYATESVFKSGAKVIDRGPVLNTLSCQVDENGVIKEFFPDDIKEYATGTGHVYASKTINIDNSEKRVFLEWIYQGKINLYVYHGKNINIFAVENQSGQVFMLPAKDINGKDFKEFITNLTTDCHVVQDAIPYLKYTRNSLIEFFERYDKCVGKPFPKTVFGVTAGLGLSSLIPPVTSAYTQFLNQDHLRYIVTPKIGLFVDIPIRTSNLNFHSEFSFVAVKRAFSVTANNLIYKPDINLFSFNVPLNFRYYLKEMRVQPFVDFGYTQVLTIVDSQSYDVYKTDPVNPDRQIYQTSGDMSVKKYRSGVNFGAGFKRRPETGRVIVAEFRLSRFFHRWESISYGGSEIDLIVGCTF